MSSPAEKQNCFAGWRGVGLVAATYVYFLIFAQFGFLKRLAELGVAGGHLTLIMGAMAAGGIVSSLAVPVFENRWRLERRLQTGCFGCAAGALLTLAPLNLATGAVIAWVIGGSLGLLTVTLVTHLQLWIGATRPLLKIGLGVGLAYFICNCPRLFEASPAAMAWVAAGLGLAGIGLAGRTPNQARQDGELPVGGTRPPIWLVLGCFTALVWLDSAAFYIIQNTPELKSDTWAGPRRLWQNGGVHFLGALGGALLLQRRGLAATLTVAFVFLAGACWLLMEPARGGVAGLGYPLGVSLYSVALVAFPAYLATTASARERAWLAGWLYAVAGWLGSGLGIGMAEHLRRIPPAFILGAALLFFAGHGWNQFHARKREWLTTAALLLAAAGWSAVAPSPYPPAAAPSPSALVERGRQVCLSEGCPGTDRTTRRGGVGATALRDGSRRRRPDAANLEGEF